MAAAYDCRRTSRAARARAAARAGPAAGPGGRPGAQRCPAGRSSGSGWPGRWCTTRPCCCCTSRPGLDRAQRGCGLDPAAGWPRSGGLRPRAVRRAPGGGRPATSCPTWRRSRTGSSSSTAAGRSGSTRSASCRRRSRPRTYRLRVARPGRAAAGAGAGRRRLGGGRPRRPGRAGARRRGGPRPGCSPSWSRPASRSAAFAPLGGALEATYLRPGGGPGASERRVAGVG